LWIALVHISMINKHGFPAKPARSECLFDCSSAKSGRNIYSSPDILHTPWSAFENLFPMLTSYRIVLTHASISCNGSLTAFPFIILFFNHSQLRSLWELSI
jgi:hypothetical protein